MTQCKLTPQEFIQNAFSPVVATMCSPLVDQICRKNNLSFIELLQPFCKLNVEVQIRDPTGTAVPIKNLRITVTDVNSRPPQPTLARKFLNASVIVQNDIRMTALATVDYNLEIPSSIPWYEIWRETFLQVQYPSDHEFTKHYLACMIVVSSSEPNPQEAVHKMLNHLTQLQSSTQSKLPKWFSANVLRFFVVLHDTIDGNIDNAVKTVDSLKQSYGISNCFLLQLNSRPAGLSDEQFLPDPWSQFLMRKTEPSDMPESESPRTPADSGGVTSMPNNVMTDTPILSRASTSPTMNRSLTGQKLEIGQEVNEGGTSPVTFHPLSPEIEIRNAPMVDEEEIINVPMNNNVWQGSASTPTVVHGACLTTEDIEQLKLLVHEFCLRSLLPHVEKQIQQLSELISNKKGVSRSLFSATKRWFSPNKPGQPGTTTAVNAVIYSSDSPELQLRRLGDLYFMFGHYPMSFQVYHSAKRDFNADQAWLYYAGALEMAALSAFMCGEVTRKTCDYMEESIVTYLYTCHMPQFATRATLLSTECLKGKTQFGEAAHQFIRMTSEDSDLRSALLLEQAAYCFLHCTKPKMVRKYAFHIVLAGHRFSKCSQRKHSLRCYRQAFQVYNNKEWTLAEDHIYFSIGRQASNLKQLDEATHAFSQLLTPKSRQSAQQQTIFLKEYLNTFYLLTKESDENGKSLPLLPIPILESDLTRVLLGPQPPVTTPGRVPASGITFATDISDEAFHKWNKLEEMMVYEAANAQPMIFKPMITLFGAKNSGAKPVAVVGDPIQVSLSFTNTLQIVLPLKDIYLLWTFTGATFAIGNELLSAEEDNRVDVIRTHVVAGCNLPPDCRQQVTLSVTPLAVGELVIEGVGYSVVNAANPDGQMAVVGKQVFQIRGPKMKTKEKWVFGEDKRLQITVASSTPCLQVGFSEIYQETLCNEIQNVSIELRNSGSTSLHKLMMATSLPHLFSFSTPFYLNKQLNEHNSDNPSVKEREIRKNHITHIKLPSSFNGRLEPGQSHVLTCWLRTPSAKGTAAVDLLFYYENTDPNCISKYRLVRHLWHFSIQDSLETVINTKHSSNCNNLETLTMSLQATNSSQLHHAVISEITLLQAALLSPNWKLSKDVIIPKDANLQSQESVHMLLKAYRSPNKSVFNSTELSLGQLVQVNPDLKQPCTNFAYKRIYIEYNAFNANDTRKNDCLDRIEAMLILHWHAIVIDSAGTKRDVVGQHYVPVNKLHKIADVQKDPNLNFSLFNNEIDHQSFALNQSVPPLIVLQQQVTYSLKHPAILKHDFSASTMCIVPVCLVVHSSADADLNVKIHTLGTSSAATFHVNRNELYNPNASNHFRWMGHSEYVFSLGAFSSEQLLLNVAVISPGTYDLGGRLEVLTTPKNHQYEPVRQHCRVQSALIIKNVS